MAHSEHTNKCCTVSGDASQLQEVYGEPRAALIMQMESVVSSPVSGKVKRVLVKENDSIAQGDLTVEITH